MAPRSLLALAVLCTALTLTAAQTCGNTNNWSKLGFTASSFTTTPCPSPPKNCTCVSKNYAVGLFKIKFPPTLYPDYKVGVPGPWKLQTQTRGSCCAACNSMNEGNNGTCGWWIHMVHGGTAGSNCAGIDACGICLVFPVSPTQPACTTLTCSNPPFNNGLAANVSSMGKACIGGKNDPHFIGADGVKFDFNGVPDKSFCLVTDPSYQVNMKMRGYYDHRTIGASVLRGGAAVRTWIKELGVLWFDARTGATHTFKMTARDGTSQTRDDGYASSILIDGVDLPSMSPGDKIESDGGLSLTYKGVVSRGGGFYTLDVYQLDIEGLLSLDIKLRVAHPLLQTADDAMAHINIQFLTVATSEDTHGVIGQTFRAGREPRALDYRALSTLLGRDVAADSEVGRGYLDGVASDYETSDTLSSDCRYSAFGGKKLPKLPEYRGNPILTKLKGSL